ncbi:MAG: DUF1906 domain-containing protein [Bacilli bacterium]|nr:DUF1906 domain-containing protein [Bacilli bacterium]
MDEMVFRTQQWLNSTYGNDSRYNEIEENGKTGWATIYALTRALQIELGIQSTADNFGTTSRSLYGQSPLQRNDGVEDNKYAILQGALWYKGYNPGHYYAENHTFSKVFDASVENAVIQLKTDAGFINPDGVVTVNLMAALLSMDSFKLLSSYGGDTNIRLFQQEMNRMYENYIGIMPCDGIYGRNTNKALIYAIQAEESMPTSVANGNFGPSTKRCCPTIPYNGSEKSYTNSTYSASQIQRFAKIFNFGLYANGFGNGTFSTSIDSNTIKQFQNHLAIPATGKADLATWLSVAISCGDTSRSAKAADCATILDEAKANTLVNNGYEIIGRYLTGVISGGISKALSKAEIEIIFDAGLRFFPIYQTSARSESYFTETQGAEDALAAIEAAEEFKIPYQSTIYFAVDFDAMDYQITNSIIPYFRAVSLNIKAKYKVGIYGARNICSRVSDAGYAVSSFVGDMSTGFSGNLGFKIPDNWAFDQFATVTIGTGEGELEIDKNGYSGRDTGVHRVYSSENDEHNDGEHNNNIQPDVLINRSGNRIPVYEYKRAGGTGWYSYECAGDIIGYIYPDEFYTRYHTGEPFHDYTTGNDQWLSDGDAVHKVCFRDSTGSMSIGYIQEELSATDYNQVESSLPYQEPFHYYNVSYNQESEKYDLIKQNTTNSEVPFTFDVKNTTPYYNSTGELLGTLQPGEKIIIVKNSSGYASSVGGKSYPWLMWFNKRLPIGESTYVDLDQSNNTGAFVNLGYEIGTLYEERAIW